METLSQSIIASKLPTGCTMAAALRVFIGLATVAVIVQSALGGNYVVGGAGGWNLGADFDTWASSQSFKPGDTLTFTYGLLHSVVEVTKANYDACSTNSPIASFTDGNSIVKLSTPGKRYFICGASGHCSGGMKVTINTVSAATAAPPTSTTPPAATAAPPTSTTPPAATAAPPTPAAPPTKPSEAPAAAPSLDAPSTGDSPPLAPAMTPTTSPSVEQASDTPSAAPPPKPSAANSVRLLAEIGLGLATTTLMALTF